MKNIAFFFVLILCIFISPVNAQNATRGAKSVKTTKAAPCIPNYNFSNSRSMNDLKAVQKKGITESAMLQQEAIIASSATSSKKYIRRVGIAANIPGNYVVSKTSTPEYNPVLKNAANIKLQAPVSQPIDVRKTAAPELKETTAPNARVSQSQPINIRKNVKAEDEVKE